MGKGRRGKIRDEKGRGKRREGKGDGKRGKPEKNVENRNFTKFSTCGAPVPTNPPQSGLNLARKYEPTVYSSVPNFIVIGTILLLYNHP